MSKHEFNVYGLPTHELPLFQEKAGREWVDYGFDNGYGDYLRDLYLGSSIQSAVVSGVSEMISVRWRSQYRFVPTSSQAIPIAF